MPRDCLRASPNPNTVTESARTPFLDDMKEEPHGRENCFLELAGPRALGLEKNPQVLSILKHLLPHARRFRRADVFREGRRLAYTTAKRAMTMPTSGSERMSECRC